MLKNILIISLVALLVSAQVADARIYSFSMGSEIESFSYFDSLVRILRNATKDDTVKLVYNRENLGGKQAVADYVQKALQKTKAKTVAVLKAPVYSAASEIACYAGSIEGLSRTNFMMFHHVWIDDGDGETPLAIDNNDDPRMKDAVNYQRNQLKTCVPRILSTNQLNLIINQFKEVYITHLK